MDATTQKNVDLWLNERYDEETKKEVRELARHHPQELIDAFYTHLEFGTAGLRGIMGVGSNRMNVYTVRTATQALANHLAKQPTSNEDKHSVFIGYDSRHNSKLFAEEAAKVLAANNIRAYICKELRPTPLVSFGCRFEECSAAIMVTASHNPPQYNGYKVYWSDGGQVLPPHDIGIMAEYNALTDIAMIKRVDSLNHPLIEHVGEEVDHAYLNAINALQNYPESNQANGGRLKIVYTSLHGTGITLMPQAMALWGFTDVTPVKKQVIPDGDFPTAPSPNPEERKALTMGIETLQQIKGDLLIATDPDADRVAIAVRHQGEIHLLNGNQIACVCLDHVCKALLSQGRMPSRPAVIKSIVTTELFQAIADAYGVACFNVLTGFKYIAERIREWEQEPNGYHYIFGGEESYGYLLGTETRDKDAILGGVLLAEVALHAKLQGKTLVDCLYDLYRKHGVYYEKVLSIKFEESKEGREQMTKGMATLRHSPPKEILGQAVVVLEDYQRSLKTDLRTGKTEPLTLPSSDMLLLWLEDRTKLIVRPSGTEPKIKIYCGLVNRSNASIPDALKEAEKRADQLLEALKQQLQ